MINYKEYPPDWNEIRDRILARANNCCEKCGIMNYSINKRGSKVVLTIAHLFHDHLNHDVKDVDLRAWCQACHLRYDLHRHIAKRKYGSDFFKTQPLLFP